MKKLFLLFVLFCSQMASGQTRWNFLAGTTLSTFDTDLLEDYGFQTFYDFYESEGGNTTSDATNSFRAGFYMAVEADFALSSKSFIKTGLKFTTTGDSFFFKTNDIQYQGTYGSTSDGKFKWRPRIDYLVVPINYGIQPHYQISIYGGISPHIMMNNMLRTNRFEGDADDLDEKWDREDNLITAKSMVLFANFGISYFLNDGITVIDLRANRSLSSVYDDSAFDGSSAAFNDAGLWSIELGIGVFLGRLPDPMD